MKTVPAFICSIFAVALSMIVSYPSHASDKPSSAEIKSTPYAVVVSKNLNSKKHRVRIYNDAGQENILFTVNGIQGKNYQLYIFDMDSKLIAQASVHDHETSVLNNIEKGNYLFQ